jgi:hypothetical protein
VALANNDYKLYVDDVHCTMNDIDLVSDAIYGLGVDGGPVRDYGHDRHYCVDGVDFPP